MNPCASPAVASPSSSSSTFSGVGVGVAAAVATAAFIGIYRAFERTCSEREPCTDTKDDGGSCGSRNNSGGSGDYASPPGDRGADVGKYEKVVVDAPDAPNVSGGKRVEWRRKRRKAVDHLEFDTMLLRSWEARRALFRTQYSWFTRRRVAQYVVQFSEPHCKQKRRAAPPKKIERIPVLQPFDHSKFNFNKADPREVIAELRTTADGLLRWHWRSLKSTLSRKAPNAVLINVSPLTPGHCVIAVNAKSCNSQALTRDAIILGILMMGDSPRSDSRILFNSLGAYASQNHLHLHIVYIEGLGFNSFQRCRMNEEKAGEEVVNVPLFPMEAACEDAKNCEEITRGISLIHGYPVKFFRFVEASDSDSVEGLASRVHFLVRRMQERGIAHNIVFSPAISSKAKKRCIYVIPRKNQVCNSGPVCEGLPLKFAVIEISGLVLARSEEQFKGLTQGMIEREMTRNVCLEKAELQSLKEFLVKAANDSQRRSASESC